MAALRSIAIALFPALIAASLLAAPEALAQDKKDEPCVPGKPCAAASPTKSAPARKATPHHRARLAKKVEGPVATNLGFRMLPGGASEVFVVLNAKAEPQVIKSPGTLTYVLKGFHVPVHNNTHALHTQYFKTPIADARLVPGDGEVRVVVVLRANAEPTVAMPEFDPGRSWELQIKFPAGDYQPETHEVLPPSQRPKQETPAAPAKAAKGKKKPAAKAPGPPAP